MKITKLLFFGILLINIYAFGASNNPPNIIIIYIDDMGYGDIEPFGNKINKTPNLSKMAAEGMKFTSFYSANSVCSPSRAALMTGSYPIRNGMHKGSWRTVLFPKDTHGLHPNELTIAEILKEKGYATACFGKWHLGDQPEFLPLNQGFDTYYGIPYSNDMWPESRASENWKIPPTPLPVLENNEVVGIVNTMEGQAQWCKLFTEASVEYIEKHKDKPFFIYLPHPFIHHPRMARKEFLTSAGIPEDQELDEEMLKTSYKYLIEERTRAQIEEVDWSVGEILNALKENNIAQNTLVLFTSDNGGNMPKSNLPLKGKKGSTWEGGMREPCIFWWPETIPANTENNQIATTMDLLPTIANLVDYKLPKDLNIDGKNIIPMLLGEENTKSEYEAFYYFDEERLEAVRQGDWKLRLGALYNLETDIGETTNVADKNPEIVKRLNWLIEEKQKYFSHCDNTRPHGYNPNPEYLILKNQ